jgi:hypothetical protein
MNINKAQWVTEGDNVRLSMPIGKVDKERRIVSGFATLDNVDKQGDVVDTSASLSAFKNFRGNLREMHQPSAVGKVVSFKEDRFFDPGTKKFYSGVYVSAYVSKGAQDAWEKVLDGTYSGFSIGGNIKKFDDEYNEGTDKAVRIIKEYELHELSLVDNPANQFANIFSIEKVNGETTVDGYLSKTEIENVFWDSENDMVLLSDSDSALSPTSGKPMQNIGFVEKADSDNSDVIKFLVDSAKGINTIEINKEVSPMTDVTNDATEVAVEEAQVAPEADAAVEAAEGSVEKSAQPGEDMDSKDKKKMDEDEMSKAKSEKSEDEDEDEDEMSKSKDKKSYDEDEDEMSKAKSAMPDDEDKTEVAKSDDALETAIADVKDTVSKAFSDLTETVKSLYEHVSELSKSLDAVKNDVTASKTVFDEFGKRVDAVVADTAFRKSGDVGDIVQEPEVKVQKSLWGGRFLTNNDLF